MSEWRPLRLGNAISIRHGYSFRGEYFADDGNGPLLLTPGNFMLGGGFKPGKPKYYFGPVPDGFALVAGDLVVTMTDLSKSGDTLGYPAIIPTGQRYLHNQRIGLVTVTMPDRIDKGYLYYALRTDSYRSHVLAGATGSTVRHTSPSRICDYEFTTPKLREQQTIARVLGVLDDKIASNEQIGFAYEELMRTRFQELRIDAEGESADEISAAELIEFNPRMPTIRSGDAVYLDMSAVPTNSARVHEWSRREPKSGTRFMNNDTVMARITPCLENGKVAFIDFMADGEVGVGSTEFIVMRAKPDVPVQLPYFLARSPRFQNHAIRNMVGSSGRQRVGAARLADFPIRRLGRDSLREFGAAASRAFLHMKSLDAESKALAELRDTLLPRLMSGEIRVREAERVVEDAT